jgi:hypothetical protein
MLRFALLSMLSSKAICSDYSSSTLSMMTRVEHTFSSTRHVHLLDRSSVRVVSAAQPEVRLRCVYILEDPFVLPPQTH